MGALAGTGCSKGMIDRVVVTPSATFDSVRVALFFKQDVQVLLAGTVPFNGYGFIYMNPSTPSSPFEMGFDFKTSISSDPGYVELTPTLYLPNGAPIGLTYPVVEIKGTQPISPNFDLYGYVDVEKHAWFGTAAVFGMSENTEIPLGMTITQVFRRDQTGAPALFASVYGPTVGTSGEVKRAGGIAVFANIDYLRTSMGQGAETYLPERNVIVTESGEEIQSRNLSKRKLRRFERSMIREANRAAVTH
ncbi:MAG: hypothetical protein A2X94_10520 [Bdellovibrionales bacterium GWB1_55_8]|nr:MAG: hypothetical protein A2X94_10520 [Bdellovibrionales bacterium GWB1_55_8]